MYPARARWNFAARAVVRRGRDAEPNADTLARAAFCLGLGLSFGCDSPQTQIEFYAILGGISGKRRSMPEHTWLAETNRAASLATLLWS